MTQANDDNPVLTSSKCQRCGHFLECAACGVTNSEADLCQEFGTAQCDSCVRFAGCKEAAKGEAICTKFETRLTISEDHARFQFSCNKNYLHSNWIDTADWKLEPEYLEKIAVALHVRVQDVIEAKTAFDEKNAHSSAKDNSIISQSTDPQNQQSLSTEQTEAFNQTFDLILQCRVCHGRILNPDHPEFDEFDTAIFSCSQCGGKFSKVLVKRNETEIPTIETFKKSQIGKRCDTTLKTVYDTYLKWLYIGEDKDVIDLVLCSFIQPKISGDPVWYTLIAPSGGTKTELLRANQTDNAYLLDSLTARTLISGKITYDADGKPKPLGGILPQINDKVLIIKDFTLILQKREEERNEIFSQLRCLYDGYLNYGFGSLPVPIREKARIGLITASTPAIDFYTKLYVTLGERFLKIRHDSDPDKAIAQAMKNMGKEDQMRLEMATVTNDFLEQFYKNDDALKVEDLTVEQLKDIQEMAKATAILRTPVTMKAWRGEISEVTVGTIEVPTRLSKQLLKTAQSLALIRGRTTVNDADIETTRRVAKDTCYPYRIAIIKAMDTENREYSTREISEKTDIPLSTVWRELKELEYLCVIKCNINEDKWIADGWLLKNKSLSILFHKLQMDGGEGERGSGVVCETPLTAERVTQCYNLLRYHENEFEGAIPISVIKDTPALNALLKDGKAVNIDSEHVGVVR